MFWFSIQVTKRNDLPSTSNKSNTTSRESSRTHDSSCESSVSFRKKQVRFYRTVYVKVLENEFAASAYTSPDGGVPLEIYAAKRQDFWYTKEEIERFCNEAEEEERKNKEPFELNKVPEEVESVVSLSTTFLYLKKSISSTSCCVSKLPSIFSKNQDQEESRKYLKVKKPDGFFLPPI